MVFSQNILNSIIFLYFRRLLGIFSIENPSKPILSALRSTLITLFPNFYSAFSYNSYKNLEPCKTYHYPCKDHPINSMLIYGKDQITDMIRFHSNETQLFCIISFLYISLKSSKSPFYHFGYNLFF